jgi:cytoskeleton protein RodZ
MSVEQRRTGTREATSFGDSLKRQRLERSVNLREMSQATKISVRYLEALERNDFAALPGGAFTKGFVRAYAMFVGLDPEEMINHYLLEMSKRRTEPEPEAFTSAEDRRRTRLKVALVITAVVTFLALLGWAAWWLLNRFGS